MMKRTEGRSTWAAAEQRRHSDDPGEEDGQAGHPGTAHGPVRHGRVDSRPGGRTGHAGVPVTVGAHSCQGCRRRCQLQRSGVHVRGLPHDHGVPRTRVIGQAGDPVHPEDGSQEEQNECSLPEHCHPLVDVSTPPYPHPVRVSTLISGGRDEGQVTMRRAPAYPPMSTLPTSTGLPKVVAWTILPPPI